MYPTDAKPPTTPTSKSPAKIVPLIAVSPSSSPPSSSAGRFLSSSSSPFLGLSNLRLWGMLVGFWRVCFLVCLREEQGLRTWKRLNLKLWRKEEGEGEKEKENEEGLMWCVSRGEWDGEEGEEEQRHGLGVRILRDWRRIRSEERLRDCHVIVTVVVVMIDEWVLVVCELWCEEGGAFEKRLVCPRGRFLACRWMPRGFWIS